MQKNQTKNEYKAVCKARPVQTSVTWASSTGQNSSISCPWAREKRRLRCGRLSSSRTDLLPDLGLGLDGRLADLLLQQPQPAALQKQRQKIWRHLMPLKSAKDKSNLNLCPDERESPLQSSSHSKREQVVHQWCRRCGKHDKYLKHYFKKHRTTTSMEPHDTSSASTSCREESP